MPEQTTRDYSKFYVPAAIVLAGVIIGGALVVALKPSTSGAPPAPTGGAQPPAVNIVDVKVAGDPYIGKPDAPVVLAYWSDFQCPFCKQFEMQTLPDIIKKYVDTGKVKVVFKDYQFLGNDSFIAGAYGRAMWRLYPDKYFAFRVAMYGAQDEENGGFGDEASIVKVLGTITGVDPEKVKADVAANREKYNAEIEADRSEGADFGIQGTPGIITGKTLIPGAVPLAQFEQAIDSQLK